MEKELRLPLLTGKKQGKEDALLYVQLFALGVGSLVAWNTVCPTFDWINEKYPGKSAPQTYTLLNFLPNLVFQPITVCYGYLIPLNIRIIGAYAFNAVFLLSIPFLVQFLPVSLSYSLLMALALLLGLCNSISQSSIYALAGTLPPAYISAVIAGSGLVGVIMNLARMMCLWAFGDRKEQLMRSTVVFYGLATAILVLGLISQWFIMRNRFVEECVRKTSSKLHAWSENEVEKPEIMRVFGVIWTFMLVQFLVLLATFGVYPTLAISPGDPALSSAWFSALMLFVYSFADYLGRNLPSYYVPSEFGLWSIVLCRFLFWLTFTSASSANPPFGLDNLWGKVTNMGVFAFLGGYSGTLAMIQAPTAVKASCKDVAGAMMSAITALGLVSGSLVAFFLT
jgi:hypothetical protein